LAKRPAILPRGAIEPYGGYRLAWEEAVTQCRDVLYRWAAVSRYGTYTELADLVDKIPWPERAHTHEGQQMGYLLGRVVVDELRTNEDRPVISALVIGKDEGMPSTGFWSLLNQLNVDIGTSDLSRLEFWSNEVKRCFETYGAVRTKG
jgi:hypothetical protein